MGRESPVKFRFSLRLCFLLVLLASVVFATAYWIRRLPRERPGRYLSTHPDGWFREAELRDVYANRHQLDRNETGNFIRDADVKEISGYRTLTILRIQAEFVTDDGMAHVAKLKDLQQLEIQAQNMTDEGLRHLHGLDKLEKLRVNWCDVTRDGLRELQNALPDCEIIWDGEPFP